MNRPVEAARQYLKRNGLSSLGLLACLLVSSVFLYGATESLSHSGYLGTQNISSFVFACAALMFVTGASSILAPRRLSGYLALTFYCAALLLASLAVVASGSVMALATVALVFVAALGIGVVLLQYLTPPGDFSNLELFSLQAALGLGILSHATLLLGAVRFLYTPVAVGLLVAILGLTSRHLLRRYPFPTLKKGLLNPADGRLHLFFGTSIALFLTIVLIQSLSPPTHYDDLNYHFLVPYQEVTAHRLLVLPDVIQSYFYQGVEMLYVLAFLVGGGETAATLINNVLGILTAVSLAGFAGRTISAEGRFLAPALWFTTPIVAKVMTTGYVDTGTALFSFLATLSVRSYLADPSARAAMLGGVLIGFAVSTKLNAAILACILLLLGGGLLAYRRRWLETRFFVISYCAGAALSGFAWPLTRYLQTGNPTFPFLNAIFKAPGHPAVNESFNFSMFGFGKTLLDFLMIPWNLTIHGDRFVEGMHPNAIGAALMLSLLIVLAIRRISWDIRFLGCVALAYVGVWFLHVQYSRYLFPVMPVIVIIATQGIFQIVGCLTAWRRAIVLHLICFSIFAPCLVIWLSSYFRIPERLPLSVAFGRESRSDYLSRVIPVYKPYEMISEACHSQSGKVLAIGNQFGYLCPSMMPWISPRAGLVWQQWLDEGYTESIRQWEFSYVLTDSTSLDIESLPFIQSGYLERHASLIYSKGKIKLYDMQADPNQLENIAASMADSPALENLRTAALERETRAETAPYADDPEVMEQLRSLGYVGGRLSSHKPNPAGLLAALDSGFEQVGPRDQRWSPSTVTPPELIVSYNTSGYLAAREGNQVLRLALLGPSDGGSGSTASAKFGKAAFDVSGGSSYILSFDMVCNGWIDNPRVRVHFFAEDGAETRVLSRRVERCSREWERFRVRWDAPRDSVSASLEFGFAFEGNYQHHRYIQFDGLALEEAR